MIAIANDHAGTELKNYLMESLDAEYNFLNFGTDTNDSVDYPDHVHPLANAISTQKCVLGILICGSGNGVCMTANKHQDIRAALCWNEEIAKLARQHNNANVICVPARFVNQSEALNMVKTFLETSFEGGRHALRVDKISHNV
jgi:ribose 5-phosphate isomerase B